MRDSAGGLRRPDRLPLPLDRLWTPLARCPSTGTALLAAGSGSPAALVFVAAMSAGFLLCNAIERTRRTREPVTAPSS